MNISLTAEQWIIATTVATVVGAAGIWATFAVVSYALASTKKPAQGGGDNSGSNVRDWLQTLHREKAIVRSVFTQIIALGTILGFQPSTEVILLIEGIAVGVSMIWIRHGVTPVDSPDMEAIERAKS